MDRDWDKFIPHDRVEMHPRWKTAQRTDPSVTHWGDGESEKFGHLPSFGGRRTSYQCQTCGKRDAFRNPHKCGEAADWRQVPSYAGASPDVLAFEEFCKAWATECYRILLPGGHLLAFGATRMQHRLVVGIEDAGFEIRDQLAWLYGSGFPKSLDVSKQIDKKDGHWRGRAGEIESDNGSMERPNYERTEKGDPVTNEAKQWEGFGSALKPAHEVIVLARKPLAGPLYENILKFGAGALNIEACRVGTDGDTTPLSGRRARRVAPRNFPPSATVRADAGGRWPTNVLLSHLPECQGSGAHHTEVLCAPGCPVAELNEASGEGTSPSREPRTFTRSTDGTKYGGPYKKGDDVDVYGYGDNGGAARFFFIAKPRTRERVGGTMRNLHPTVKPIDLMRHLIRLVTPPGGLIVDPFLGSGTTGCAAMVEGFRFIGIENDQESYDTALARVSDYAFAHHRERPITE